VVGHTIRTVLLGYCNHLQSLDISHDYTVASVKRKKCIELSKGEPLSLYTREPGARWKSMEVHGLEIPIVTDVHESEP